MTAPAPLVVVGLDAADKDLLLAWAADGTLPAFRRLLGEARFGATRNPPGLYVGAVWPSFYTGLPPTRHGRYCHQQLRPGSYETAPVHAEDVRGEPFWEPLSRAGRRVAVLDVPKSSLSTQLRGVQVVDWTTHDPDHDSLRTTPAELGSEILARFGADPIGPCNAERTTAAEFAELRDQLVARAGRKADLALELLGRGGWDCFTVVFAESHCVGHQCWHLHDPGHPRHEPTLARSVGDPLRDVYVALDRAVGRILLEAGDGATVLVLASHGMGPHYDGTFLLDRILERLAGPEAATGRPLLVRTLRNLASRVPTGLHRRLGPLARPLRRGLGVGQRDVRGDACFRVPNNDVYGAIRINLAGREPNGRIAPGPECERLCERLTRELLEVTNLDTGEPLVRRVWLTRELYPGEPVDALPDLLVEWNRSAPIARVHSPRTGTLRATYRNCRTGDHRDEGLFFWKGPGIRPGPVRDAIRVEDFAPTLAARLGVALPQPWGRSRLDALGA